MRRRKSSAGAKKISEPSGAPLEGDPMVALIRSTAAKLFTVPRVAIPLVGVVIAGIGLDPGVTFVLHTRSTVILQHSLHRAV